MANGFVTAGGGGGGAVILRALGQSGNKVTATLGSKTREGTIPTSGALELKLPNLGLWSVKTTSGSFSFTQDVKVYRYGITECWALAKKAFADCTPAEIQFIAKAGLCEAFGWKIGDRHSVTMTDGEEIVLQIYDFNHDVGIDGKTLLPLTLGMENCFKTKAYINNPSTTTGGWEASQFRTVTLPGIRQKFPAEWLNIMTVCEKKTAAGAKSTAIKTTNEDLFLFSEIEVLGAPVLSIAGEGVLYPIFTDNGSRVKLVNGTPSMWWTRSPTTGPSYFCDIKADGTYGPNWNDDCGIALGFCVG